MKNGIEHIPNKLDDPREFLNLIAYSEMKRRGMTDLRIMLRYNISYSQMSEFKKKHGLVGMKRGALHDHLQALQSSAKKLTQHSG